MRLDTWVPGMKVKCAGKCGRLLTVDHFRVYKDDNTQKMYTRAECKECEVAERQARRKAC